MKCLFRIIILVIIVSSITHCDSTGNDIFDIDIEKRLKIESQFKKYLDKSYKFKGKNYNIPGGSLAIIQSGNITLLKSYGEKRIGDSSNVQTDDVITIGSLSKFITAITALKLYEDKALDLNMRINELINGQKLILRQSEFQLQADQISMRDLLQHRTGIPDELPSGIDEYGPSVCSTLDSAYKEYASIHSEDPLWMPPESHWNYSNANYIFAAAAIEAASTRRFEEISQDLILDPVGMKQASWESEKIEASNSFAYGYDYWSSDMSQAQLMELSPGSTPCRIYRPAAGLHASIEDIAKLAVALVHKDPDLVTEYSLHYILDDRVSTGDPAWDYSYGLFIGRDKKNQVLIAHDGISWGYSTVMFVSPDSGNGIVAFLHAGNTFHTDLWTFAQESLMELNNSELAEIRPGQEDNHPELQSWSGEYEIQNYDPEFTEAVPKYSSNQIWLEYDEESETLYWVDEYGYAPLIAKGGSRYEVNYEESIYNFNIRLEYDRENSLYHIINRNFVGVKNISNI